MQHRRLARRSVPKSHKKRPGRATPRREAIESWLVHQPGCPARTGPGIKRPGTRVHRRGLGRRPLPHRVVDSDDCATLRRQKEAAGHTDGRAARRASGGLTDSDARRTG
jgi:hypothetical protein